MILHLLCFSLLFATTIIIAIISVIFFLSVYGIGFLQELFGIKKLLPNGDFLIASSFILLIAFLTGTRTTWSGVPFLVSIMLMLMLILILILILMMALILFTIEMHFIAIIVIIIIIIILSPFVFELLFGLRIIILFVIATAIHIWWTILALPRLT